MAEQSPPDEIPGVDPVYDAAFRRVGVVRVEEAVDLFNTAQVLDSRSVPLGPSLAVVGNAWTVAIMAADVLLELGGRLAKLSSESLSALDAILPAGWNRQNPIDLQGDADLNRYIDTITTCLTDGSVDGILVIHAPHATTFPVDLARAVTRLSKKTAKPIIAAFVGGSEMRQGMDILHNHDIPAYGTPEEAARTYLYMYEYKRSLELLYQTPEDLPVEGAPPEFHLRRLIQRAVREGVRVLAHEESSIFLSNYGIPVRGGVKTTTIREALAEAANMAFPLVISLMPVSSDGSGIRQRVEVRRTEELAGALQGLERQRKESPEGAYLETIAIRSVTETPDYELYLGMARDKEFGSVMRFGIGGIGRDIFKDCAIGLPPLNQTLALRLIEESKVPLLFQGYMGRKGVDLSGLEQILVSFSNLVVDFPEITAINIDPLAVSDGKLTALDTRIFINAGPASGPAHPHLVITPYPTRYMKPWRFRDGTEVLLRPIRPEDEWLMHDLYSALSQKTLEQRFFRVMKDMQHETLTRFCNIDYDREIAIVAELRGEGKRRIIGISRLIIQANSRAEFAVVVSDDYQGRGLGRKLIDVLIGIGQEKGLNEICGIVLTENSGMLKLVRRLGFATSLQPDGITSVTLKLR